MSSWLSAIAKGAAYLYGGGGAEEEAEAQHNDYQYEEEYEQAEVKQESSASHQYVPRNVYASAKGELWKFNPKREEFKVLVNEVEALVIEHDSGDFVSSFQIVRKSGDLLFSETICNELQIQYNKSNHSMVFAMYNGAKDRLEILSFIFSDEAKEEEFKMAIAIKLYETNRQESFDRLLKTKDIAEHERSWMTQAYEMDVDNDEQYDETETDLHELCDDVAMLDMQDCDNNDEFDVASDDDEEEEEEEFDEEEKDEYDPDDRRRNKWADAANKGYSDEEELERHTDNVLPPSPFKDTAEAGAKNKHITGSKMFNRTYVVREMKSGASALGYFKHNDENELEYQGKIAIKDKKHRNFTPSKVIQHKSDRNMLLLSKDKPGKVNVLNLDKGKVVEEWQTGDVDEDDGVDVVDIAPLRKHDEMTDNAMVYGLSNNSMFQIDGRIPTKNKIIDSKQNTYKSIHNMNAMATSGNGFIATAATDGKIRMYNSIEKKAKTCLPGLGNEVTHIEISDDGMWILATCTDYIMVIPTKVPGTERTGFEGRGMGKLKPHPYVLRLKVKDIQKYKLRKVEFTPAHFDQGKNITEHWIISSTGPYIIKWNFNKLKKCGIINSYSIRKAHSKVVHNEFRFDHQDDLLVTETNSVYAQHSKAQKK